jgi:hypothetical protein
MIVQLFERRTQLQAEALREHSQWPKGYFSEQQEIPMPDDKSKVGEPDRSKVATDEDYEVNQLAQKYGISSAQARELIERFGNNRENLYAAAEMLNQEA